MTTPVGDFLEEVRLRRDPPPTPHYMSMEANLSPIVAGRIISGKIARPHKRTIIKLMRRWGTPDDEAKMLHLAGYLEPASRHIERDKILRILLNQCGLLDKYKQTVMSDYGNPDDFDSWLAMVLLDPIFGAAGFSYDEIRKYYREHDVEMLRHVMGKITAETLREARANEVAGHSRRFLLELSSQLGLDVTGVIESLEVKVVRLVQSYLELPDHQQNGLLDIVESLAESYRRDNGEERSDEDSDHPAKKKEGG